MAKRLTSEKNAEKKQVRVVRVGTLLDLKVQIRCVIAWAVLDADQTLKAVGSLLILQAPRRRGHQ